jgi:flagellar biosynthesis/type III secretory pathway chaperone
MSAPWAGANAQRVAPPASLTELARQLLVTLRSERQLYAELLELTHAEREAIVGDARLSLADGPLPLARIVDEKERLTTRLSELEASRTRLAAALAAALGLPPTTRLSEALPHLAPPVAAALEAERVALLTSAQTLAEANAANADLLQAALASTRSTISYLRSLHGCLYSSDGRTAASAPPTHRLDFQA